MSQSCQSMTTIAPSNNKWNRRETDGVKRNAAKWNSMKQNGVKWNIMRQNSVKWSGAKQKDVKQNNIKSVMQKTWNSENWSMRKWTKNQTDIKQGHNQLEPLYTTEIDEQSRENVLPPEKQYQSHCVPPVNTSSQQQALRALSHQQEQLIPCTNISITNSKTKPKECMLVSKVCGVLHQEHIAM